MAQPYQQLNDPMTGGISQMILRVADQAHIPPDPANRDRYEYEEWLAAGNEPDPPSPLPEPAAPDDPMLVATQGNLAGMNARLDSLEKSVELILSHLTKGDRGG